MAACSAKNCRNRCDRGLKKYRCFRFPANQKRRKLWADACGRGYDWLPSPHARLCEVHFEDSQFEQHRQDGLKKLKPNAVPTLFVAPTPSTLSNKANVSYPGEENSNESYTLEYERKFDPHTYSQGKLEHVVADKQKTAELADSVEHLPDAATQSERMNQSNTCPVVVKLQNVEDNEFDIIGRNYALKLKRLSRDQRIHAEKLIGDVFYEAELGNLSRETVVTQRSAENQIIFQLPTMYSLPVTPYVTQNETAK